MKLRVAPFFQGPEDEEGVKTRMKKYSFKIQLCIFLFIFLVFLSVRGGNTALIVKAAIALGASALTDSLLTLVRNKRLILTESSLVTGLIIGFVLSSSTAWWVFCLAAALAITSKYMLRIRGRHIFNPAGFGLFVVLLIFKEQTSWQGAYYWYIVAPLGLYFAWRIKRLCIVSSYYITTILLYGFQAYIQRRPFIEEILYINHFFVFIMLIEPKTSPIAMKEKSIFGFLAGVLMFILYATRFPYGAELPALLVSNALYALARKRKEA